MPRRATTGPSRLVALYARVPAELKAAIRNHAQRAGRGEARETEAILRAGIAALYGPDADGASTTGE